MRCKLVGMFVVGIALSGVVHADSMRCGKWVVNESASLDELTQKCGQPQNREVTKEDNYAVNPNGARVKTGSQTVKERWVYQASSRALPTAVLIVDGKIVSISRAD